MSQVSSKASSKFFQFANPTRFLRWSRYLVAPAYVITLVLCGLGLYYAFFNSPADYQQGDSVRIMYIHVPSAYLASMIYSSMAIASIVALIWKHPLADIFAKAAAPIGLVFTICALATGSLWGKPTWGTYWVWDARLTSVLLLAFIYLGHIALSNAFDDPARGRKMAAIFCIVGAVNLPIIRYSVEWWNTLHQPASLLTEDGPAMPAEMLTPLFLMMGGFTFLFIALSVQRMQVELLSLRVRQLMVRQLRRAENG